MKWVVLISLILSSFSVSASVSPDYLKLREEAQKIMGSKENVAQRAMFYILMYLESGKRYTFGLSAAWGITMFELKLRKFNVFGLTGLRKFREKFYEATQEAFIDNYANYYFAKLHPYDPPLHEMTREVSVGLQTLHQTLLEKRSFDFEARHSMYRAILEFEQPFVIQPLLAEGYNSIRIGLTQWFLQRPASLASECVSRPFKIDNFMTAKERIQGELNGHQVIEEEGKYDCILEEVISQPLFTDRYRRDPYTYADNLRTNILNNSFDLN